MLRALTLALADLGDRRVLAVLAKSLLVTLLLFVGLGLLLAWALRGVDPCDWAGIDPCPIGASISGLGAVVLTGIGLWLLFPAVALGVIAGFADEVVAAVERRHELAAGGRRLGLIGAALLGLRGSARLLVYNLIALPFYLMLLLTGVGTLALFVLVNGLALGSDLGELVAARHGDRGDRRMWLRATRGPRMAIGTAVAAIFLVPVLNLLAPVIGAAAMTHFFHATKART
jgi:uncharacterized protein involved in cysteine biosynthesis